MKIVAYIIVIFFLFPVKGRCESSSQQSDSVATLFRLFLDAFIVKKKYFANYTI